MADRPPRGRGRREPLPTGSCSAPPTSPAPSRASRTRSSRRPRSAPTPTCVLIGIPTRGAVLARRLAAAIAEFTGSRPGRRHRSTPRSTATTCAAARPARSSDTDGARRRRRRHAGRARRRRAVLRAHGARRAGRAGRARPPARGAARRAGRPRAPRAADPRRLRRQERADRARRADRRAARRDRRPRRRARCGAARSRRRRRDRREAPALGRPTSTPPPRPACSTPPTGSSRRCWAARCASCPRCAGAPSITMFYENSTRTRVSFEIAGKWMSADTVNVSGDAARRWARASRCATPR